jgi:hypothetical protein
MLSAWLAPYVQWEYQGVRLGDSSGIDRLMFLMTRVAAREARLREIPPDTEILRGLNLIKENADRAHDADLVTALLGIEGSLLFEPDELPGSIAIVLELVRQVPDLSGPQPARAIEAPRRTEQPRPGAPLARHEIGPVSDQRDMDRERQPASSHHATRDVEI